MTLDGKGGNIEQLMICGNVQDIGERREIAGSSFLKEEKRGARLDTP